MALLALFDIDGTLTKGCSSDIAALTELCKTVHKKTIRVESKKIQGKTFSLVLEQLLGTKEIMLKESLRAYPSIFKRYFSSNSLHIQPGVEPLLNHLKKEKCFLGLVTGNLYSVAMAKLKRVGIKHYFGFGGFGNDGRIRDQLVRAALKRAEARGFDPKQDDVVMFGDTPGDIEAGKKTAIPTVAVATGIFSQRVLKKYSPFCVVPNFKDQNRILSLIKRGN